MTRQNLLPVAALVLATGGAAANGGQQSELVVYASGRLGAGVTWLDALLVLVAVVGATGAGLAFARRWPTLLLAAVPLDLVLLVASLDPPADLRLPLVVVATAPRLVTLLAVLAGAQDLGIPALAGFVVAGYVLGGNLLGGYLPGAHWLLAAGAVGGLLATTYYPTLNRRATVSAALATPAAPTPSVDLSTPAATRPSPSADLGAAAANRATPSVDRPSPSPRAVPSPASTPDRRPLVIGLLASLLSLLPLLLQGASAQETLGLVGFVFAAAAVVLGALSGWRSLAWLVATAVVVLGVGLPMGVDWPYAVIGVIAGCALSLLPLRAFIAAALCLVSTFVGSSIPGVVFAALACVAASALPSLAKRSSTPVVFGPLLAVAVTAGAELILWSSVTFAGQQGGVLFGGGQVTVPLLCAAAVLAAALGIVDRRTLNS